MLTKLKKALFKVSGTEPLIVSAATGDGIDPLLDLLVEQLAQGERVSPVALASAEADDEMPAKPWSPL